MPQIDYAALARQHGGRPVAAPPPPAVDYAALALEQGGVPAASPPPAAETPASDPRTAGIGDPRVRGWMDQMNTRGTELRAEAVEHPIRTAGMIALGAAGQVGRAAARVLPIPSAAKAGAKFQQVMSKAKNVSVDISGPGNLALEVAEKGARGGTTPRAVTGFIRRITDPEKGPLTYEEARDWASNISRLSADEFQRLTPVMRREMIRFRVALNQAVGRAAESVGEGKTYTSAMKEFSRAAKLRDVADDVWTQTKRWAIPGTIVGYGLNKISDLVRGN